jgi:hypothetical protein
METLVYNQAHAFTKDRGTDWKALSTIALVGHRFLLLGKKVPEEATR